MADDQDAAAASTPPRRRARISDVFDVTEDMINFADKYQQVWESEAKATLALGEFLSARAASLRSQVDLMRMGTDSFRKYNDWSETLFGVRPDSFMRGLLDQLESFSPRGRRVRTRQQ
jgi:hypothetical protein